MKDFAYLIGASFSEICLFLPKRRLGKIDLRASLARFWLFKCNTVVFSVSCGFADFAHERSDLKPKFPWHFSVLHRSLFRPTIAGHFSWKRYRCVPQFKSRTRKDSLRHQMRVTPLLIFSAEPKRKPFKRDESTFRDFVARSAASPLKTSQVDSLA